MQVHEQVRGLELNNTFALLWLPLEAKTNMKLQLGCECWFHPWLDFYVLWFSSSFYVCKHRRGKCFFNQKFLPSLHFCLFNFFFIVPFATMVPQTFSFNNYTTRMLPHSPILDVHTHTLTLTQSLQSVGTCMFSVCGTLSRPMYT